jgi:hypothetical protein
MALPGEHTFDGREVFRMFLQNVLHDSAIDLGIVMDKGVAKTDHVEPLLLKL